MSETDNTTEQTTKLYTEFTDFKKNLPGVWNSIKDFYAVNKNQHNEFWLSTRFASCIVLSSLHSPLRDYIVLMDFPSTVIQYYEIFRLRADTTVSIVDIYSGIESTNLSDSDSDEEN